MSTPLSDVESEVAGRPRDAAGHLAAQKSEERLALLAQAGRMLGSSLDEEPRFAEILRLVVREFANVALLDLRDNGSALMRVEPSPLCL